MVKTKICACSHRMGDHKNKATSCDFDDCNCQKFILVREEYNQTVIRLDREKRFGKNS